VSDLDRLPQPYRLICRGCGHQRTGDFGVDGFDTARHRCCDARHRQNLQKFTT
jgi:hypothetical protein